MTHSYVSTATPPPAPAGALRATLAPPTARPRAKAVYIYHGPTVSPEGAQEVQETLAHMCKHRDLVHPPISLVVSAEADCSESTITHDYRPHELAQFVSILETLLTIKHRRFGLLGV